MKKTLSVLHRLLSSSSFPRRNCLGKMSTIAVPVCPKFNSIKESENNRSDLSGFKFRLVSYNILAQVYVKSSLFPHSPSPCLKWKSRSKAILTVLKSFGADFLCLQELDEYDSFYKGNMESRGYSSIYIQRSGQKRDGCGIFYKHDSAELVLEETIEYNDLVNLVQDSSISCDAKHIDMLSGGNEDAGPKDGSATKKSPEDSEDPNDPRVRLKRDCVGIMAAFKLKDPSHHTVIVANTHLYWDPEWADVKLAQAKYLLSRLAQFKILVSNRFDSAPSVILSGDFNSTPGDKVPQLECSGDLPIPICSVYAFTRGEPAFTNCTPGFTGTIDYIFFSPSSLIKPVSLLQLSESDAPDIVGGLPNYHHPSDHLPIGAEFTINRA
ncbi:carbon catabolite repressor protein 4 homolog 4 isoform X2 [Malania oleifera]|uniref:carbon catabolite repressor protein 4 homolog 4 isoform X2 n=1 Tax=Malania oleifera TaxID=397392 RepID=UPI0025AE6CC5|nr:carbon catabolite repressor protein 4 homolog 4 isoform X2 [Malania oleifera]